MIPMPNKLTNGMLTGLAALTLGACDPQQKQDIRVHVAELPYTESRRNSNTGEIDLAAIVIFEDSAGNRYKFGAVDRIQSTQTNATAAYRNGDEYLLRFSETGKKDSDNIIPVYYADALDAKAYAQGDSISIKNLIR